MFREPRKVRGFGVPLAIFILVGAAVLATAIVLLSATQQVSSAIDLQGAQAQQTARAGLEWGIHKALRLASCVNAPGTTFSPGIAASMQVTVVCTSSPHTEAGVALTMYEITATACNQVGVCPGGVPATATYVERQLRVVVGSN